VPHMSRSVCRWPTTAEGHEDQFLVPGMSPRYGFRKETIAGTRRNGQDAPNLSVGYEFRKETIAGTHGNERDAREILWASG
jgi:hypothetical protein